MSVSSPSLRPAFRRVGVGPQLRARVFSVTCRTSTPSSCVQCGVSDLNCELVSSVWRAGPQPGARELSVACRTSTAIPRVQCGVPDLNCDPASSVWRAGPQPRSCEFSVACRTSTAIERIGSSCRKSVSKK